jgi:hypothetical protein
MKVCWCVALSFIQASLVNCSSNVIFYATSEGTPFKTISLTGLVGVGFLDYVPTPLDRKSGKRERRKSSVSHVASSTEW